MVAILKITTDSNTCTFQKKFCLKLLPDFEVHTLFSKVTGFNFAAKYTANTKTGIVTGNTKVKEIILATDSAIPTAITTNIQKTKFQKLSLFILELIKPRLAGVVSGLFNVSITLSNNHWFNIYNFNLAQFIRTTKRLVIIFCLCALNGSIATAGTARNQLETALKRFIATTERHYLIPTGLLDAIAKVESEYNPYALNIAGQKVMAKTKTEAMYVIKQALDQGITNIDIGAVQVNYRWHKERFTNVEEMLDTKSNIRYGASLLLALRKQYGSWHEAIKRYHSGNRDLSKKYSRKIMLAMMKSK